jgi:hypothetical protein
MPEELNSEPTPGAHLKANPEFPLVQLRAHLGKSASFDLDFARGIQEGDPNARLAPGPPKKTSQNQSIHKKSDS